MNSYDEITQELSQEELFYEPKPRKKEVSTEDNYFQAQIRPYWEMTKRVHGEDKRMTRLLYMKAMELFTKRQTMFRESIEWALKNRLHPKQFAKMVGTILNK